MRSRFAVLAPFVAAAVFLGAAVELLGVCGPFTDVAADVFCPLVLEIFYMGITTGTTATTYDPNANTSRLQMATFLSRTVDSVLKRGSRRAALNQNWTKRVASSVGITNVPGFGSLPESDGQDIWAPSYVNGTVARVRASDGRLLETWDGADNAQDVLLGVAGSVYVSGQGLTPNLYRINPTQAAGAVTTVATNLLGVPRDLAFDGTHIWVACSGSPASPGVAIVDPGTSAPLTVTTVTTGFGALWGILFDGTNIWVVDTGAGALRKLDSAGAILQTVTLGGNLQLPAFDGTNIWVPDIMNSTVSVVRASSGVILQTLTGNGLSSPHSVAFDGQRILVTDLGNSSASLWKAADLTSLGSAALPSTPTAACSDGIAFWITSNSNVLMRF